jgi:hypothetical protein
MKLPLAIAKKLKVLVDNGSLSASQLNVTHTAALLADGILIRRTQGRTKAKLLLKEVALLDNYLKNKYGINDLVSYIRGLEQENLTGKQGVEIASNTKIKKIRHFKGFLVNSYLPFSYSLNGNIYTFQPQPGSFLYIHDYETFAIPEPMTVVGVENPENFRFAERQKHLFENISPMFVSRYPQSGDLVKWLQQIPNSYLHFGDFDLAGIFIYLNEFKKYLSERSSLFIPPNLRELIRQYGNRELYNKQLHLKESILSLQDAEIQPVLDLLLGEKKVLEQQGLIGA